MKLWLLEPVNNPVNNKDNPWEPWFDKTFGSVIRAETEEQARQFAHDSSGEENDSEFSKEPWKDKKYSTCVELTGKGKAGVIIQNHESA